MGNATDNKINTDGTGGVTISSTISGTNRKLTKGGTNVGAGGIGGSVLRLQGVNTYSGDTTINTGVLGIELNGSINNSPNIIIAGGAVFEVAGVAPASYNLAGGQGIRATGTSLSGVLSLASKNLNLASNSPLQFTAFNGTTAPLTASGSGTVVLSSTNPVTVTTTTQLGVGTYTLISKFGGGSSGVSGTAPTSVTVNGSGLAANTTASLLISGGQLVLNVATPTINVSGGPLTFGNTVVGATSVEKTYTVSGSNLSANLVVTAPTDFQVSTTPGSGFGPTVTLTPSGGTVANTTIHVRFAPGSTGAKAGNITNASGGATTQNVAVSGTGISSGTFGGKIAFFSDRDGDNEIYSMNANGSGLTQVTSNSTGDSHPAFSRDGSKIAFRTDRDGNVEVYSMNADGSGQTNLTNNAALDIDPQFSPDGSKIVFASNRDGNHEIYSMNADGSGQTRLTNHSAVDGEPAWSPGGTKIVFRSTRTLNGNYDLYVMNADGTNPTQLTNNSTQGDSLSPFWSPDGTKVAFVLNQEVYAINIDGTNQTNLTNVAGIDIDPTFGPDGGKVAFASNRDGNYEIYSMNANGTSQTRLTNNPSSDNSPSWAAGDVTPGTIQFSSAAYGVGEGGGSLLVSVTRAGGSNGAVSVAYATGGGTATAGSDYAAQSGTLNWAAGDAADKSFSVPVNEDVVYEGDETFGVTLSSPGGGATLGSPSSATVTIVENESPPTVSVGDVTVAEPASGISYAVFPVTLSVASAQTVTVSFATADGTATQPGDYTSSSGALTFAAGQTSKTVAVIVKADAASDTPENFSLNLSSPANAAVNDGTGVATITAPVGGGTVLISEFRLRGPGTGNNAPTDYDAPVVVRPVGRKHGRPVMETVEEGDGPTSPQPPVGSDDGGGTSAPATAQESDEFIEIYNNTDADIIVTDSNPATCLLQVITVGPATACGWALVDLQGSVSNIPRFVIPTGTVIPARGHYLAASTGYSLAGLAAPDLTYDPPAYSGGEADYTGLALFKTADRAQFTPANVFDAVGFDGVATPYREGAGLPLSGGVAEDLQHSFVRNQTSSLPSDTGDNGADFTLVAASPAQLLSGTATLGAPGPENSSGPVTRNAGFGVTIPPGVLSSVRSLTPVTNGSLGTLSLRRRFTNNTGQSLDRLRFRVVQVTTYNNKQLFANQAEVRVLDAQLAGLGGTGLVATTVETPPAQAQGGGVNTGLVVSGSLVLAQPLAAGQSVDVEFLLGVMRGGSYQFVIVVEGGQ